MERYLKVSTSFAAVLLFSIGAMALTSSPLRAEETTIEIDGAMLDRCDAEGIGELACACWFDAIMAEEELDSITEEDVDELASEYQEELAACIDANG
ncbi:hypothetical protein [Spirulina sp. 06S082]|uniref:hypothetical protein n=1 Tax=Spirulina sp. 06S082 TaxID=3110248 RepID=UPI002B213776|nr:hypothetical protein [Spirulina sp. 06S082]MEA5467796.1 hypothetical protein [Spirulina sp. 06S082]